MGMTFWIGRYFIAVAAMFGILSVSALAQGKSLPDNALENLLWAAAASAIFIGSRYYQARRNAACALCRDPLDEKKP